MARPSFESAEHLQAMQEVAGVETPDADTRAAQEAIEKSEPSVDDQIKALKKQLDGLWRKALDQKIDVGSPAFLAVSKERAALRDQIRDLESKPRTEQKPIPVESDADILRDGAQLIGKQEDARYQEAAKDVFEKEQEIATMKAESEAVANTKEQQQIRSREAELAAEQRPTQETSPEVAPDAAALERKQRIEQLRAELATLKAGGKLPEAQPSTTPATRAEKPKESTGDAQLDALEAQANQAALDARKDNGSADIGEFRKVTAEARERRAEIAAEAKEAQAQAEAKADLEKSEQQLIAEKRKRDVAFLKPRLGLLGSSTAVKKAFGRAIGPDEFGITDFDELLTPEGEQKLKDNEYFKAASEGMREMMQTEISKLREKYSDAKTENTPDNVVPLQRKEPSFELRKAA